MKYTCYTAEEVEEIEAHWRGYWQDVQQHGYADGYAGTAYSSPYGPSKPEHNHYAYGYMLGRGARIKERRADDANH